MKNVIYSVGISLDGYLARRNGEVDFLFMPKDFSMQAFVASIDTIIAGRKTYEHGIKMGFGLRSNAQTKAIVCSKTLPAGIRDGVEFTRLSPSRLLSKLSKSEGKNIWLMGGGDLARSFFKADLIDEIHLGVLPILIGEGLPAFLPKFGDRNFKLTECKTYEGGMVNLKYQRMR